MKIKMRMKIKKIIKTLSLTTAILFSGVIAQAANSSITGLLGFTQSALNFGVNYENRLESTFGMGGFFHYSSEKKDAFKNQTMAFGAMAPAHLLDSARIDAYVAPGFAVLMIKGFDTSSYGKDDQTTFGPVWKMGVLFKMTPTLKVGLEQTEIVNWFTDKAAPDGSYTNAALNFSF